MKTITIAIAIAISLVGCIPTKEQQDAERREIWETNKAGFTNYVNARYTNEAGIPVINNLRSLGPGYFEEGADMCYRVSAVVEYYPTSKSTEREKETIQMFCKNGYCWEENYLNRKKVVYE
jgi:hypothetical protein